MCEGWESIGEGLLFGEMGRYDIKDHKLVVAMRCAFQLTNVFIFIITTCHVAPHEIETGGYIPSMKQPAMWFVFFVERDGASTQIYLCD